MRFLGLLVHDSLMKMSKTISVVKRNLSTPPVFNKRCPAQKQKHSVQTINLKKKTTPQYGSYHCHVILSWRTKSDNNLVVCFSSSASSRHIDVDCIYTSTLLVGCVICIHL